jgi:hypothetical protein
VFLHAKTGASRRLAKEGTGPPLDTPGPTGGPRKAATMARPAKEEKRDDQLAVRMTTAERAEVERNADALAISPAEFMRRRTFGYRLPDPAAVQQGQARLGSAFNRLAVNMNQIARRLNSGARPSAVEKELQDLIDRINAELDNIYGPGDHGTGPQL